MIDREASGENFREERCVNGSFVDLSNGWGMGIRGFGPNNGKADEPKP